MGMRQFFMENALCALRFFTSGSLGMRRHADLSVQPGLLCIFMEKGDKAVPFSAAAYASKQRS